MQIRTFLKVAPNLPRETSVLLRGDHGIGKSQVVRQLAALIAGATGVAGIAKVVDRRLSQMTEGDMVGLPSTDGEVTRFNPPDWYKAACDAPCTLFLDELNRATPEVMQAAFQVVLDRELNGWKLHPDTRVFAAINTGGSYTVNEMDPALLDRFWAVDLTPDAQDWVAWAKESGRVHENVVSFIAGNEKWLDPPKSVEPGQVTPSRRSWERLSQALVGAGVAELPDDALFYPMCLGYVGTEATITFHGYVKTLDSQVTGEEIINSYGAVKRKIAKLGQEKLNIAIEKMSDYVTKNLTTLTDEQGKNLQDFFRDLPAELRVSAWSKLTSSGVEKLDLARAVHKWCVDSILEVFGTKSGTSVAASPAPAPAKKSRRSKP